DVTVTADDGTSPTTVNVLNLNGLGVTGGVFSNALDSQEALFFQFVSAATGVSYNVPSGGNLNGNGTAADATLEAFDAVGATLGTIAVNGGGTHNVSTAFGGVPISAFRVRAAGDNQRISSVSWATAAVPGCSLDPSDAD